MSWKPFLLLSGLLLIPDLSLQDRIVCYYESWSVYRSEPAQYSPGAIDPFLCTHIIYAFVTFADNNTLISYDDYADITLAGFSNFTSLKSKNKDLKTLLGIGGWNEGSSRFSPLVASIDRRQQLIKNMISFLNEHNFDGLDLDWDYPGSRQGGVAADKDNYAQFIREIREEFNQYSLVSGQPSMSVPGEVGYFRRGFDIPKINEYIDWYNILSYDYYNAYDLSANHHSPLYGEVDDVLNLNYTVKLYLEAGAEKSKMVLGIPTYGRSYTLLNEDDTTIGSPADGPGDAGPYTIEKGYLAYHEICQYIKNDNWTVRQSDTQFTGPYAYSGNQWVGYDDKAMVERKAQYVADKGLGGIMFWSLNNDDFHGSCSGKPQYLISAAKKALLDRLSMIEKSKSKITVNSTILVSNSSGSTLTTTQNPISAVAENLDKPRTYKKLSNSNEVEKETGPISPDEAYIADTESRPSLASRFNMHSITIRPFNALDITKQSDSNKEQVSEDIKRVPYKVKVINRTTGSVAQNYYGNVYNYNVKIFKFYDRR